MSRFMIIYQEDASFADLECTAEGPAAILGDVDIIEGDVP